MIVVDIRKHDKLSNNLYSAFITFDYNSEIVDKIRSYPFRFYNANAKEWEIPTENVQDFVNSMGRYDIKLTGELSQLNEKKVDVDIPKGFHFKTKPFNHSCRYL